MKMGKYQLIFSRFPSFTTETLFSHRLLSTTTSKKSRVFKGNSTNKGINLNTNTLRNNTVSTNLPGKYNLGTGTNHEFRKVTYRRRLVVEALPEKIPPEPAPILRATLAATHGAIPN